MNLGNSNFSASYPNEDFAESRMASQNIFPCDHRPGSLNSMENKYSRGNYDVGFFLMVTEIFSAGQNFLRCGHLSHHMAVREIQ